MKKGVGLEKGKMRRRLSLKYAWRERMARPLRIEYEEAIYRVIARGNERGGDISL
jgi:hypothetical protein